MLSLLSARVNEGPVSSRKSEDTAARYSGAVPSHCDGIQRAKLTRMVYSSLALLMLGTLC